MGDNHRNKRIKCVICAKEYSNKKFCCPKCKYPALSFSKKAAKQIARIEAYKQDSGYGAQVISKPEAIIQVDAQVTDTKPSLPDNTSEKKSVKDQPYYPFFVLSLFLAVGFGLMDGSFFDFNVMTASYYTYYEAGNQFMQCCMSYTGLAFLLMCLAYRKAPLLVSLVMIMIMIACETFNVLDTAALYHINGSSISLILSHLLILIPALWTAVLLLTALRAPSNQEK